MNRFVKSLEHDWYKQRIIGLMVCVLAFFLVLLLRLM